MLIYLIYILFYYVTQYAVTKKYRYYRSMINLWLYVNCKKLFGLANLIFRSRQTCNDVNGNYA